LFATQPESSFARPNFARDEAVDDVPVVPDAVVAAGSPGSGDMLGAWDGDTKIVPMGNRHARLVVRPDEFDDFGRNGMVAAWRNQDQHSPYDGEDAAY